MDIHIALTETLSAIVSVATTEPGTGAREARIKQRFLEERTEKSPLARAFAYSEDRFGYLPANSSNCLAGITCPFNAASFAERP